MKKVAIFVDWDNLRCEIKKAKTNQKRTTEKIVKFNFNNSKHIAKIFSYCLNSDEEFYRIFFYTAKPITDNEIRAMLKKTSDIAAFDAYLKTRNPDHIYNISKTFLDSMIKEDFIALRKGKMQVRGIKTGGVPDIVQKQVDMLIGLDISEVSYNKHADKIIIFSKDTDMIPALKTARINGMTVTIASLKESNHISSELVSHADLVKEISLVEIDKIL
ncbi:NYN domain-containing protein [Aliarcobacter butzleri]|uniref:NYN domain-containing protein n=1 Tax=Aliarcobacter butzleri TaxID=28197 RepID=UPI003AF6450D